MIRQRVMEFAARQILASCTVLPLLGAQAAPVPGYPVAPRPLPEAEEIALAMSAAPTEISSRADVYVLRATGFVRVRTGTNGCACLVGRDLHQGSRYPICFDQEGTRTIMMREMKEGALRATGMSEAAVVRAVDAAFTSGELRRPLRPAMAYMMSPRQVLFSSPFADGFLVGAWSPHVMITLEGARPEQFGLARDSKVDVISMDHQGERFAELVVKVPKWSDGTPVAAARP
ncbi:MAG TPA: hypothetical protein VHE78_04205 [Gemmatimonadaceae bacterium]|nr:hypothetical protein [Gemmatimonadaceae bacterium]